MDEKKSIPLFDPNDRGGNSRSHLNPRIFNLVVGGDIDPIMLRALLNKQVTKGVMLVHQRDDVVVIEPYGFDGKILNIPPRQLFKDFSERHFEIAPLTHDIFGNDPTERDQFIEPKHKKQGVFDRTGTSPGATLGKKPKWWKR